MNDEVLLAIVESEQGDRLGVFAPMVGWWSDLPHPGALLGPGSRIGALAQLNRRFALVLPEGAAGRVVEGLPTQRAVPVEHGQLLFRLAPFGLAADETTEAGERGVGPTSAADLPPGTSAVVSPTDGVFYRGASPDAPPFVDVGGTVRSGQAVGLVEVMKTFNQILYGGPGQPDKAEIVEIRVTDAEEVRAGQILVVVREP